MNVQRLIGFLMILMAATFAFTYGWPNANGATRALHEHWKERPIRLPGIKKEITYDKYFLMGAIVLLIQGLRLVFGAWP